MALLAGPSNDDPHRIVLREGDVAVGLPDADGAGVLLKSAASFSQGTWKPMDGQKMQNARRALDRAMVCQSSEK